MAFSRSRCPTALRVLVLLICVAPLATADDWPCFRGPKYDGISPEKGFRTDWQQLPQRVWQRDIGSGFSAFACVGDKVYTAGTQNKQQVLFCLNADTGDVVWQTPIEKEYPDKQGGDGPRGTPTVNDGRVYIQGGWGRLLCCDATSGKELWSTSFTAKPTWGYAGSVLIDGERALTQAGGKLGGLVAFNKQTGAVIWEAGAGAAPGYSTPYPFVFEGQPYIAALLAKKLIIVAPETGKEVFSLPWETDYDVNAAQPLYHDGYLFVSTGYKTGSAVFKLARDGAQLKAEPVWGAPERSQVILAKFHSACLWDGKLYVADQRALKCVDFMTGKELWKDRAFKEGSSVLLADGHLLAQSGDGELQIAPLSPEKFAPTAKLELQTGRSWTAPTLYRGKLYVRNLKGAACYNLAK